MTTPATTVEQAKALLKAVASSDPQIMTSMELSLLLDDPTVTRAQLAKVTVAIADMFVGLGRAMLLSGGGTDPWGSDARVWLHELIDGVADSELRGLLEAAE